MSDLFGLKQPRYEDAAAAAMLSAWRNETASLAHVAKVPASRNCELCVCHMQLISISFDLSFLVIAIT